MVEEVTDKENNHQNKIHIKDIYDKNINFLIGSGASIDLIPTLSLKIKNNAGEKQTIETLATYFDHENNDKAKALLFMHYYNTCIKKAHIDSDLFDDGNSFLFEENEVNNSKAYKTFIETILSILNKRNLNDRNCNIFTTNYDGGIELAADELLKDQNKDFIINDGARGFSSKYIHAKNFNSVSYQTSIFNKYKTCISQINVIHLHGSIYWQNKSNNILVSYENIDFKKIDETINNDLERFSEVLLSEDATINDLEELEINDSDISQFWTEYNKLPVVNPTKWKFHETVFEQHYYQMLRYMSYEFEKPNSVIITFGFSFADEHILQLVQRSLSNPKLIIYICCFNESEMRGMKEKFKGFSNVIYISCEDNLDFQKFNDSVFCINCKNENN